MEGICEALQRPQARRDEGGLARVPPGAVERLKAVLEALIASHEERAEMYRDKTERKPSMTNNIAEIEQGANEALSENRRELAEETAQINREPDLSEEAKARYVGEARERAQAKYVRIIDVHDQAIRNGNR
jgi:hypothetical protein